MLDSSVRLHHKFQIEIKSHYRLQRDQKQTEYAFDVYMFVPNSLDLNPDNYPKYLFYRDLQSDIRFETPTVLLRDIAAGEKSPFQNLEAAFHRLATEVEPDSLREYENQIKMFSCVFRKALREHIGFLSRKSDPRDIEHLVAQFISSTRQIVDQYRDLRGIITIPTIDEQTFCIYTLIDEYVSLLAEECSYELLELLKRQDLDHNADYTKELLGLIRAEVDYRKAKGYPSIAVKEGDNEELLYRRNVLKDYTQSVLQLNTRTRPEGKVTQQLIFGLAAGLAMVWATAVALYAQYKFGIFTMAFFVSLVISYIFKDRIKELVRDYLSSKILRSFFDQKVNICPGSGRQQIGFSRESFSFVDDEAVDKEVMRVRNRDKIARIGDYSLGEEIILYRKKITLFSKSFEQLYRNFPLKGVSDISRFNVARLTRKMVNPKSPLFALDNGGYQRVTGRRVYHVNFVIKYSFQDEECYRRIRVVMDRSGIKRIEEVGPPV
jgi:hypothetical protein